MKVPFRALSDQQLVDWVRLSLGLDALYGPPASHYEACGSYLRLERLRRAADTSCARCGGAGYYDGERIEMRCQCTHLPQRALGAGLRPGMGAPGFVYRRRRAG